MASKSFVCIRLATYEDEEEATFLKKMYVGRSGDLENTVFGILAPDGKTKLTGTGRSPRFVFRNAADMANEMELIAFEYLGEDDVPFKSLPTMKDLRLAVNVASCDGIPLVVVYGKDAKQLAELEQKLVQLVYSDELMGRFSYIKTTDSKQLKAIKGFKDNGFGCFLVKPGEYGLDGKIEKSWSADTSADELKAALVKVAGGTKKVVKNHQSHVREGTRDGVNWQTEIPVTDQMSLRAEQNRKKNRSRNER